MPHSNNLCYEFGLFHFDLERRVLTREGTPVSLTPKATDILLLLLQNAGQLVKKEELMKVVWPNTFVEESNATQNIFTLRRALGEERAGRRYIETIARRGYRFAAKVKCVPCSDKQPPDGANGHDSLSEFAASPMLAVLPFINATGDQNIEYLADGITDDLTNNLSRISKLRILSRTGVFCYRGGESDPKEVGKALGVDAILSGRIQMRSSGPGITAELVKVENGCQLWGESFDLAAKDILKIQDEIARQVASKLGLKLTGDEEKSITTRYTENSAAYQAYLEGRYHWSKYTKAGIEEAIVHFRQAIELDSNYALAYSAIVDCYLRLATNYLPPTQDLITYANNLHDEEKFTLSETTVASLDRLRRRYEWDWKVAERELRRAKELGTTFPAAHQWRAAYFRSLSLFEECSGTLMPVSDKINGGKIAPCRFPTEYGLCIDVTPAEEVQVLCSIVREQIQVGNFGAGCLLLRPWWTIGAWPTLEGLTLHSSADLLFTIGTLVSSVSSSGQVSRGQKDAEALLSGSVAFFEYLGTRTRAAEARMELARCYYREGLFDIARVMLSAALAQLSQNENELRGVCLVLLGVIERDAGRLTDSFRCLTQAAATLQRASPLVRGRYHHEIATTLKELAISSFCEEYAQDSLEHFNKALYELEAIGNHRYLAAAENNLGYLLLNLGQTGQSEVHLLRAKRLFDSFADKVRSAQVDDTLAHLYMDLGELGLAEQTISSAVQTLEGTDEEALLAEALSTKGLILCKLGRYSDAKRGFEAAHRVAERCGDREGAGRALLMMAEEMSDTLAPDERQAVSIQLKKLLALTQQASIVTRLQQTLARMGSGKLHS